MFTWYLVFKFLHILAAIVAVGSNITYGVWSVRASNDPAHIGFDGLRSWVDEHHPRHIVHGHVHPIAGLAARSFGSSRVHWISGARMLQLD